MPNKRTLKINVVPMTGCYEKGKNTYGRYAVTVTLDTGGFTMRHDCNGLGLNLPEAEHYANLLRTCVKEDHLAL